MNGKAKTKGGYLSAAVQAIKRLRQSAQSFPPKVLFSGFNQLCPQMEWGFQSGSVSHSSLLTGSRGSNVTLNRNAHAKSAALQLYPSLPPPSSLPMAGLVERRVPDSMRP